MKTNILLHKPQKTRELIAPLEKLLIFSQYFDPEETRLPAKLVY